MTLRGWLHFTSACVLLLVCSLHFTLSLHFTPGPQSAVCSPQSEFCTDRIGKTVIVKRTLRIRGKIQTECKMQTESKTQAGCKMQTEDCRLGVKCWPSQKKKTQIHVNDHLLNICFHKSIPFFLNRRRRTENIIAILNLLTSPFNFRHTWPWIGTTRPCLPLNKSCWPKIL